MQEPTIKQKRKVDTIITVHYDFFKLPLPQRFSYILKVLKVVFKKKGYRYDFIRLDVINEETYTLDGIYGNNKTEESS